jgi:hypothetical protein
MCRVVQIILLDPADSTASSPSKVLGPFSILLDSSRFVPLKQGLQNLSIVLHVDPFYSGVFPIVCFLRIWLIDKYCAFSCTD